KTDGSSPFDLVLSHSGDNFAVMGMHFKIGLYEHQSAGGLQGLIDLVRKNAGLLEPGAISKVVVKAYEPAFGIIGDPAKRDPHTRQSADHSMVYIVATLLRKAIERRDQVANQDSDDVWKALMLMPEDYSQDALMNPATRELMAKITFAYGGPEYDAKYPDGIPTSVEIEADSKTFDSGLVMYPAGHARNATASLAGLLARKFELLGKIGLPDGQDVAPLLGKLGNLSEMSAEEVSTIYDFEIAERLGYE
ncbi:MAG TPA: hypothetical protein VG944_23945, partial [Fimbriimonas sp.]|nr:hypothetical protein [Fimbriimonas sp.]